MIYFFYGEDAYSVKVRTKEVVADFVKGQGGSDFNVVYLDGSSANSNIFTSNVMALPFLGDKRLVVIANILLDNGNKEEKKKIAGILKNVPATTSLLFVEGGMPDKRESLFKALEKEKGAEYFPLPNEARLVRFALDRFAKEEVSFTKEAVTMLCQYVGPDFWRLENEIAKLCAYHKATGNEITKKEVALMTEPINTLKIFDLTDAIAEKNEKRAITILERFLKDGEEEIKIFGLMVYQFRTMLMIDSFRGMPAKEIATRTGIHPFVVQKNLPLLSGFSSKKLYDFYLHLHETDWAMKSGKIEPGLALPLLIVEFCERC